MDIVLPLDVRKEKRHKCKTKEGPKARGLSGGSFRASVRGSVQGSSGGSFGAYVWGSGRPDYKSGTNGPQDFQ